MKTRLTPFAKILFVACFIGIIALIIYAARVGFGVVINSAFFVGFISGISSAFYLIRRKKETVTNLILISC